MSERVVTYAKFHENLFLPGLGELGSSLPPISKTIRDLKITQAQDGLRVMANGREIIVPFPNVVLFVLAPVENKTA